jgi:TPR repeat protein
MTCQDAMARLTFALACAVCAACSRGRSSDTSQPAPSATTMPLALAIGACPELGACERECEAGSADRCRRLAVTYAFGQGVDKDEPRATALYEKACAMKDPSACVFAGQMHEFGRGVGKDDSVAAGYYEQACDLQWPTGCYNLAVLYERGTGVPADRQRAGVLYQVACTAGAQIACDKAKEMHAPPPIPFLDGGLPL